MSVRRALGFSLIEVLAAMVIFSSGAVILFGWIAQTADRLSRMSAEQQSLFADLTGLEYMRTLNPMQQPSGETRINDVTIRWEAKPIGDESAVRDGGAEGNYIVQLYQVQVSTESHQRGGSSQSIYLAGWRERVLARGARPFSEILERSRDAPKSP